VEESAALNRKTGDIPGLVFSLAGLGVTYQILGEWDKSEQYYKEVSSIFQKVRDYHSSVWNHFLPGWLYLEKGEYVKARENFEKEYEIHEKAGAKSEKMSDSQFLIQSYIELGEIEKAQSLIDNLQKFALEVKDKLLLAGAYRLRGMLLRTQRKWQESIEYFEKGLNEYDALNARQWYVYSFAKFFLSEYARMYLERNEEGDREKARNLLDQALEIFQKIGAKKDIEKIEAKLMYIEGRQVTLEPKPIGHVATGHAELDRLLYGGLPPNYAIVLTSPPCDERDLLIKSFLETGAKKGEVAFYVTIDPGLTKPLAEEFQSNFHLFICNPQADAIIKNLPNVFKLKGVENLTEIGIALTSAIHKIDPSQKGPRRICIGLVSDVLLQHHAVQTRKWLTALIPELKSAGFTTLAVIDPQIHPPEELHAILGLFEGEINIREKETEKGLQKFLKIKKMSNQKYLQDELPLIREDLH